MSNPTNAVDATSEPLAKPHPINEPIPSPSTSEMDPWAASSKATTPVAVADKEEPLPPPPRQEPPVFETIEHSKTTKEVLSEFDPLADKEEQAAQSAWANAESHPPPPPKAEESTVSSDGPVAPAKGSKPPPLPLKDSTKKDQDTNPIGEQPPSRPTSASPFVTAFPSLVNSFARTLTNLGGGSRPETPASKPEVPSSSAANTLTFEHQNQTAPVPPVKAGKVTKIDAEQKQPPPFDFTKFLEQMKTRSAEPVTKYFRSFLSHFAKKEFTVNDQVKVVHQFLHFIGPKMRECDVWKKESEEEFDNSLEAMEKLVMNRIYDYSFTPQIALIGRKILTDDLERDSILTQRIRLFQWIEEKHLDIPVGENNQGFLSFANQELLKINHYKAPRDKVICILNCCKVIFGLIRNLKRDEGADAFIPLLILVVIQSNPEHLLSNIEYIQRFRSPHKLQSEAGYYLSSLMGAVSFIETMDHTSLSNITKEEFEAKVEEAIQHLPPSPNVTPATPTQQDDGKLEEKTILPEPPRTPSAAPAVGEESARALQLPTPASLAEDTRKFLQMTGTLAQETLSRPLNAIGRIFSEALDDMEDERRRRMEQQEYEDEHDGLYATPVQPHQMPPGAIQTPYRPRIRPTGSGGSSPGTRTPDFAHSPSNNSLAPIQQPNFFFQGGNTPIRSPSPAAGNRNPNYPGYLTTPGGPPHLQQQRGPGGEHDILAEVGAIDNAHRAAATEALKQMFPDVEDEVMQMVLDANGGDLGRSIDSLLEMSVGD